MTVNFAMFIALALSMAGFMLGYRRAWAVGRGEKSSCYPPQVVAAIRLFVWEEDND